MSEEHDIFEEMFKETLQDIEIPVSKGLWNRIKISIWGKRKYFFLLWFFIGLIGISLGAFLLAESKNNKNASRVNSHKSFKRTQNTTEILIDSTNNLVDKSKVIKNKTEQNINEIANTTIKNNYTTSSDKNENTKSIAKKIKTQNESSLANTKSLKPSKTIETKTDKDPIKETKTIEVKTNLASINQNKINSDTNLIPLSNAIVVNDTLQPSDSLKSTQKDSVNLIAKIKNDSITKSDSLSENKTESIKSRFFLSTDGGALFPSIKYNAVNSILTNSINNSTKSTISYNYNVQLGCSISKKVNVLAGLGFIKYKNDYNYSTTFATKDTITDFYLDSLGNPQYYSYIKDTTTTIQLSEKHQFRYLTMPINAEYLFKLGTRFKLMTSLGVIIHQQIKSELAWIDPESNNTIFKNSTDQKTLFASLSGGLKLEYQINKHWGVHLSGTYIHSLTNVNDNYENVIVRPNAVNANVGLRYYFYCK